MKSSVCSFVWASSFAVVVVACSSIPGVCDDPGACREGDAGTTDAVSEGGIDAPPGCELTKDAKDSPACVDDAVGVFVDASAGSDSNAGTKAAPVKTIATALSKVGPKPRVYLCEGTYPEAVKLTSAVSLYGGFACGSWAYNGAKPKLAPSTKGLALSIQGATSPVVLADLDLTARDATEPGESSVALFVATSNELTLRRTNVTAGRGLDAATTADPPSNLFSENIADLDGNPATGTNGAPAKTCACKSYGTSTGGKGGNGGAPAPNGEAGVSTPQPAPMPPRTGAGGDGYTAAVGFCIQGRAGADGAARAGGEGAKSSGTLEPTGWVPASGAPGLAGNPGGGGGGGGGGISNGSGGGGCGGCGGAGGLGGKAGGSSIAIASLGVKLRIETVTLATADAGNGAAGSKGGGGGGGGGGTVGGCSGGNGGNGAGGSGGGGGAGGVSAGVVIKGATIQGAPAVTKGKPGTAGGVSTPGDGGTNPLGTAPGGNPGTAGKEGVAQDVLEIQ